MQNENASSNIDPTIKYSTACMPQKTIVPLESQETIKDSFAYRGYGVRNKGDLMGYFYSDTVFNLSRKVLTNTKTFTLKNELHLARRQNKRNETELSSGFK